jgi:signal transduction histidine kinase
LGKTAFLSIDAAEARWPKLLSLAVHEFRTPITVVAGYIRMVLKERAGPISDQQRKLLEEAEKSCGRLSALVTEMSDLSALEGGTAAFNAATVDLEAVLTEAAGSVPALPDREVGLVVDDSGPARLSGDATRLRAALTALIVALRREVVSSDRLILRRVSGEFGGGLVSRLAIGEPETIDTIASADPAALDRFDEWRGGSGLSLAIARRVIERHGGKVYAPPGGTNAGALIVLPRI